MATSKLAVSTRGWSLQSLVEKSKNFCIADRVHANAKGLRGALKSHEETGTPLVIEGFHDLPRWPNKLFSLNGFRKESMSESISVRNVHTWKDKEVPLEDFISKSRSISQFVEDGETERLYGKDAECPLSWEKMLQDESLFPSDLFCNGPNDEFRFRPASSRIETLMCYLGVGDTFTPCHKDLCASSGHNLMCYTEGGGSSFWFMTESASAPAVSAYFHSMHQELDHENHVITVEELAAAPFKVYIIEQKLGDLVLVPPRSAHQVVNYGGITLKTSWSRMTPSGLAVAFYHELPIYRRVCRPETYRIKSTVFYALRGRARELTALLVLPPEKKSASKFEETLASAINSCNSSTRIKKAKPLAHLSAQSQARELKRLLSLYDSIIHEESLIPGSQVTLRGDSSARLFKDENRVVCDFCEADIFQSFFECRTCRDNDVTGCIICPGCYVEGRTCKCERMKPMQCRPFSLLLDARSEAVTVLEQYETSTGKKVTLKLDLLRDNENVPPLFRAAHLLHTIRNTVPTKTPMRTCSVPSKASAKHRLAYTWTIYCRECHHSGCFAHILEKCKLHSAEAFLQYNVDDKSVAFHNAHNKSKDRFYNESEALLEQQTDGTMPNGYLLLAAIAMDYGSGRPLHRDRVALGWYDAEEPAEHTSPERKLEFYVLVPPLPYRVDRSRKRPRLEDDADILPTITIPSSPLTSLPASSPSLNLSTADLQPTTKKQAIVPPEQTLVPSSSSAASSSGNSTRGLPSPIPLKIGKPLPGNRQTGPTRSRKLAPSIHRSTSLNAANAVASSSTPPSNLSVRRTLTGRPLGSVIPVLHTPRPPPPRIDLIERSAERKARLSGLNFKKKEDTVNSGAVPEATLTSSSCAFQDDKRSMQSMQIHSPIPSVSDVPMPAFPAAAFDPGTLTAQSGLLHPSIPEVPAPALLSPAALGSSTAQYNHPYQPHHHIPGWYQCPEDAQIVDQHIANMGMSWSPATSAWQEPTAHNLGYQNGYAQPPFADYDPSSRMAPLLNDNHNVRTDHDPPPN